MNINRIEGPKYNVAIIGGGPAGISPFIAADRNEQVGDFIRRGVVIIEKGSKTNLGEGGLSRYQIRSNSGGIDFVEPVRVDGQYKSVRQGPRAKLLELAGSKTVVLATEAAPFLGDLGRRTAELVGDPHIHTETHVTHVNQRKDTTGVHYAVITDRGQEITARHLVLATGANEHHLSRLRQYRDKVVLSGDLISGQELERVGKGLETGKRVVFVGGSHSTFAAAEQLLGEFNIEDQGAITVVHKGSLRRYFPNEEAAHAASYPFEQGDVCPQTRRVHRYGGVRGSAGDLVARVTDGNEKRIVLHPVGSLDEAGDLFDEAGIIVQAAGYRTNVVPIYGLSEHLGPEIDRRGQVVVDAQARVLGYDGQPIPNIFALGLGYGVSPSAAIGGEPNFKGRVDSVNMFQGPVGEIIVSSILNPQ